MGGHQVARGSGEYAAAARLGRGLAERGHLVVTGGGPGAMEAANARGARGGAARRDPGATPRSGWPRSRATARRRPRGRGWPWRWPRSCPPDHARLPSACPTWFYGHEPPNPFAAGIAKFFANARREDTLVRLCTGGIVFLPGAAGTVQEVFQRRLRELLRGARGTGRR